MHPFKGHFIGGRWTVREGACYRSTNPATSEPVLEVRYGDGSEVEEAVDWACRAFADWRKLSTDRRAEYLRAFQRALQQREEALAEAITAEMGKTLHEARQEARSCAAKVEITLTEGRRLVEGFTPEGVRGGCHFLPLGVMAVIGPYNFPAHLPNGHIVPALMTGNTVIFKPSSVTPLVGQVYAEAAEAAEFPPGVFNLLQVRRGLADRLVTDRRVRGVLFTGSYAVGRRLKELTLDDPWKMLALEMGGKNCAIIAEDAHPEQAFQEVVMGAYLTTGQRCSRTARVLVHRKLAKEMEERLVEAARRIQGGDPRKRDTFMGPMASVSARQRFLDALRAAGSVAETLVPARPGDHCFVSAALHRVRRPSPDHPYLREEIFGPDLCLEVVEDLEEAVARASDSDYGLALAVFSRRREVFEEVMRRVPAGVANWNRSTVGATGRLPFGGVGKSGNYRPSGLFAPYYCTYAVAELSNSYGQTHPEPCPGFPVEALR